jgi:stage II sporulation protein GA (sporulation sigma-E factor processing peptidase)
LEEKGGLDDVIIYLDIIFLYNFLIDWILLWSTAYVLKVKPKWYRYLIGALIGALYTIMLFFPSLSVFYTLLAKFCLSVIIVYSTFGYYRLSVFLKRLSAFYLVGFLLGGGLLGIHNLLQSENTILSGIVMTHSTGFGTPITWLFIFISFPTLWILSGKSFRQLTYTSKKANYFAEVEIYFSNQVIRCRGLLDTGNQLYEPITRIPVSIFDVDLFKDVLPYSFYCQVKEKRNLHIDLFDVELGDDWMQRIRLVPYRGVSREMDLLLALRPDRLILTTTEGTFECSRALIGLNPVSLSSDGSYQAILHPQLVEENLKAGKEEGFQKSEVRRA